ncbi:MAG: hypothetical protein ABI921_01865 [Panacibacter sp.]
MQIIKIFLASSSELKEERALFEIAINRRNNEWVKKGVFLELIIWEDFIDNMSQAGLQEEYNKAITGCQIFVMLFSTKVGPYTGEEFEKAFKIFTEKSTPLIYTYFIDKYIKASQNNYRDTKSADAFRKKLKKLKHYLNESDNFDEVLRKFFGQLDRLATTGFINLEKTSQSITEKILYIKMLHLKERTATSAPLYKKFIPRINSTEDVFDESQFLELLIYSTDAPLIDVSNHSSGVVDMNILLPWKKLFFPNPTDAKDREDVHQKIQLPSNVFFSSTNFINGFQKGNTSYGARAYLFNKNLRMIVDFSTLGNYEKLQKSPPYAVRRIIKSEKESEPEKVEEIQPGVFHYQAMNIDEGDVVEIRFDINWDQVAGQ